MDKQHRKEDYEKKDNYLHRVCSLHPAKNGPDLEKTKENLGLQEMNSTL